MPPGADGVRSRPTKSIVAKGYNLCLSLALALSTIQAKVRFCSVPPQFRGRKPYGGQGPPTSLPLPPTTREDLRLDSH
ncbi:hypothetical protein TNCV_3045971 [Trichonephila clavipes]|uniref:Uncharacterized protein n=1 Tax=Trichonephila clavipes TaxID=2585209 RepID=A0A8X6RR50_TRICX|nr:hypothetical protein TNCV_3045971 [Trichonephila clavipes]